MGILKASLIALFLAAPAAAEFSLAILPRASIRYRGEGKVTPQSYVNRFGGETAPVYRLAWRGEGPWSASLTHTGVFGGGAYAEERVPDLTTGGTYQRNLLNVGFTNASIAHRVPLEICPSIEALVEMTVAREIFKRKSFKVGDGAGGFVDGGGMDDVNELSAEGLGFGMAGRHGGRLYLRWETAGALLVQIFDAKTDASAGQLYRAEGALGARSGPWSVELGGAYQFWFMLGQGNRRLHLPGTQGAVISWNRQETRVSGLSLTLRYKP